MNGIEELRLYLQQQGIPWNTEQEGGSDTPVKEEFRILMERGFTLTQFYRHSVSLLYHGAYFGEDVWKQPYHIELEKLFPPPLSLTDFGCGVGSDGLQFRDRGYDVEFVDFKDSICATFANWRLGTRNLERTVLDFSEPHRKSDLVYAFDVVEHVEDHLLLLEQIEQYGEIIAVNLLRIPEDGRTKKDVAFSFRSGSHHCGLEPDTKDHHEDRLWLCGTGGIQMMKIFIETRGFEISRTALQQTSKYFQQVADTNFVALGHKAVSVMRRVLKIVKFTGDLERSVSFEYDPSIWELVVGPTAKHRSFVRTGTRPHWAPIAPLKRWAKYKLGDEKLAYAIQWSIAHKGTSSFLRQSGHKFAEQTEYGVGLDYPKATLAAGDMQSAIRATAQRMGKDLLALIDRRWEP